MWTWRGTGYLCHKDGTAYDKTAFFEKTYDRKTEEIRKRMRSFRAKALVELQALGNKGFSKEQCRSYLRGVYDDIFDGWNKPFGYDDDESYNFHFNEIYKQYMLDKKNKLLRSSVREDIKLSQNKNPKAKEHRW